jgi:hypothetical protein
MTDGDPSQLITQAPTTLISRLMLTLDHRRQDPIDPQFARALGLTSTSPQRNSDLVQKALLSAVHAFSARWLQIPWKTKDDLMQQLWVRAHQRVYAAMTRPTYCSILALYLFGITPTATSNPERRAGDLCLEVSLQHYKEIALRSRALSPRLPSQTSLGNGLMSRDNQAPANEVALELAQMEDTAYWLGIVCDTSQSLVRCQPSILLPGNSGEHEVWKLIRKEICEFEGRSRSWRSSRLPLSIESIYSIIQHGSAYGVLVWNAISQVKAALFRNIADSTVEDATKNALQELNRFDDVFGPLLRLCERDFILLNEKIRISCCVYIFPTTFPT